MSNLSLSDFISLGHKPDSYFYLIQQEAVKHKLVEQDICHNAIWDMEISPEGRVFFSVCAELAESSYVRLYEYLPEKNDFKVHFRLEDKIIVRRREIPASKIHTSMSFFSDGRIIMTTHTTSQAPQHPTWMVEGYYHHVWEGYPGSNIILYNPDTGVLENRGIPVPHETIYGGVLDKKHNVYYFGGMIRGHAYAYDIERNTVTDLGQVSEFGSYKWVAGPDGNIYATSRKGRLFRINTDTRQIEETGYTFPYSSIPSSKTRNQLNGASVGPDGKLYMQIVWGDCLFRMDCSSGNIENLGSYLPEGLDWPYNHWMCGLYFDSSNVLWYGIFFFNVQGESAGCRLCSWDIVNGGSPKDHGFIGSELRAVHTLSEVKGFKDVLYICDGNHLFDRCGMLQIDLNKLRQEELANSPRMMCHDVAPYLSFQGGKDQYPYDDFDILSQRYIDYINQIKKHWQFISKNNESMTSPNIKVIRIWEKIGFNLPVVSLEWKTDNKLNGVCGHDEYYEFTIEDGKISDIRPSAWKPETKTLALPDGMNLPYVPGRQYMAKPSAWVEMHDGSLLVGTQDGMLCRIKGENVFSMGMACFNGPIHQMAADSTGRIVYGVAGHEMDLGMIFRYDGERGLQWLGRIYVYTDDEPYMSLSSQPVCCALSPDGSRLAVGVADRMSCVYLYDVSSY